MNKDEESTKHEKSVITARQAEICDLVKRINDLKVILLFTG